MEFKRSDINRSIDLAKEVIKHFDMYLPPFGYWTCEECRRAGKEYDEIRNCMLGWDVTDFGSEDFNNIGRTLFTVRNGKLKNPFYPKEYAEKILIDPENQRAPAHYHRSKREDIICRKGGNILVQLTQTDEDGNPSKKSFLVQKDGCTIKLAAGSILRLKPGESINIPPRTIHQFWGEEGTGYEIDGIRYTVSSEISSVCDDWNDNVFLEGYGDRFPDIEENEERRYYLCNEYPAAIESHL